MRRILDALLGAAALCAGTAAQAEWRRFETRHFIIYSERNDDRVTELATGLEKVDGLMRMAVGEPTDAGTVKVRIYEMADEDQVQAALGERNTGIAGFYTSNILGPFAVTLRRAYSAGGDFTPEIVLHHEYAHHFMLQYFPATYPNWYIEGFAELIGASKALPDGKIAYGYPAKYRGGDIAANWRDIRDILLTPPEKLQFDLYGQGWAMTHYLTFSKERSRQLRQYLLALSAGKSAAEASSAFGDLGKLNHDAHLYLLGGTFNYTPVAVPIQTPVIQKVSPVGAAEAALIPETIAFSDSSLSEVRKAEDRAREEKRREALLNRVRAKAAQFPNDPYALYLLAEVENAAGDKSRAKAAVDRLLSVQPSHVGGLALKSMLLSDAALALTGSARAEMAAQARTFAIAANKADPDDPLTYVAFYKTFPAAGTAAPADAVDALATAVEKLPRNENVRLMLVDELASESRFAEAMFALSPIANDPHDTPMRQAARERMAQLKGRAADKAVTPTKS